MVVNGTEVSVKGIADMSEQEITNYISYVKEQTHEPVDSISIACRPDGTVALDYQIRRITGYLVGTIDRWNDAKRAEEHDRVKHGLMAAHA